MDENAPAPPAGPQAVPQLTFGGYVRAALAVGLVAVLGLAAWRLTDAFMLAFGAVIVASVLATVADWTERLTPLRGRWAKAVGWPLLALVLAAAFWLLGLQTLGQFGDLAEQLPGLLDEFGSRIGLTDLSGVITDRAGEWLSHAGVLGTIAGSTATAMNALVSLIVIVVAGIFLALEPHTYRRGVVALIPAPHAGRVDEALGVAANALRLWLVGKVLTMLIIGASTALVLFLLGIPSALALGVIAGIFEFIPFFGPLLGAVPGVLIGASEGWSTLLWVVLAYLAIQQLESNVVIPIIQRRTAELPPVLGLLAIVAFGLLFGVMGVVLATPITIVLMVFVKLLYVRDGLGRQVHVVGEPDGGDSQRSES